ncbi:zinc finger BED domain-containing protein RICESLEEPER 2-like [Vicia villosa]|uniref:zinc finger BED domain-containing protein RICESLEEPER 2-like n=1 Tax=Vicia villosa TaxID=3911 RepID=UPI00273CD552|nr:zinc finger BED domain-containing protein RICESLEEPER 2-like [Vicia villosa]
MKEEWRLPHICGLQATKKKGYMAVTAHYIDGLWTLQSRILRFIYVPAPHTSERLAETLVNCLMDWNIDSKLCIVTLDNCSTNDSMIRKIKDKLSLESLIRDGSLLHMRYCAHILNLIVQEGLQVIKDGIENIRDSVGFWSAIPKRHEKFEDTARQLRIVCTRKLALDCPTRWNSTYKMLDIATEYKDVFIWLKQREYLYTCLPTNSQWQFAKDVCECLKLFNEVKMFLILHNVKF